MASALDYIKGLVPDSPTWRGVVLDQDDYNKVAQGEGVARNLPKMQKMPAVDLIRMAVRGARGEFVPGVGSTHEQQAALAEAHRRASNDPEFYKQYQQAMDTSMGKLDAKRFEAGIHAAQHRVDEPEEKPSDIEVWFRKRMGLPTAAQQKAITAYHKNAIKNSVMGRLPGYIFESGITGDERWRRADFLAKQVGQKIGLPNLAAKQALFGVGALGLGTIGLGSLLFGGGSKDDDEERPRRYAAGGYGYPYPYHNPAFGGSTSYRRFPAYGALPE